jgi:tRNA (guanine37-N1)-methyltransferase
VPDVLISGHHRRIALWQYRRALELTRERRPDLFERYLDEYGDGGTLSSALGKEEKAILAELSVTSLSKL